MRFRCRYLLIFAAACGANLSPDVASVSVTDSAGVAIVANRRPQWTTTSGWHVESEPVTSIGGDERDTHQHFQYVAAARRLSDGRVVIATESDFRWFDANGKYLMTSGRAGDLTRANLHGTMGTARAGVQRTTSALGGR